MNNPRSKKQGAKPQQRGLAVVVSLVVALGVVGIAVVFLSQSPNSDVATGDASSAEGALGEVAETSSTVAPESDDAATSAADAAAQFDSGSRQRLTPGEEFTAADEVPARMFYVRNGLEFVTTEGGVETVAAAIESLEESPSFIESIVPVSDDAALVGVCCEPAFGNQMLLDLDSGTVEGIDLFSSFPSVDVEANAVVSSGLTLELSSLDSLLARNSQSSETLAQSVDGRFARSVVLPNETVAFAFVDQVVLVSFAGEMLGSTELIGVGDLAYDERNQVIFALVESGADENQSEVSADTLVRLHPETLELIDEQSISGRARDVDVVDGWILLSHTNGSVTARSAAGGGSQTMVANSASAAVWANNDAEGE